MKTVMHKHWDKYACHSDVNELWDIMDPICHMTASDAAKYGGQCESCRRFQKSVDIVLPVE